MTEREKPIMDRLQIEASRLGCRLFRNNVGVAELVDGRFVKYGLCVGSSDLVGWAPMKIQTHHVGQTIAVFFACEVKRPGKRPTPEQAAFLAAVARAGGVHVVATCEADLRAVVDPLLL